MEDPIAHSHTEFPVVEVESRTQLEKLEINHEVISHDCDDRAHSRNVVENGASSHRAESINFLAKDNAYESKVDPLMKKSSTWNIFTSNHHHHPQSATTKASSPGLETYDQSKLGAHDYIVHSDVSYQTYTHDLPKHSHVLESPSKEFDITELLKSVDEQIRRSTNHNSGDFAHHTTTFEEHHSPVPMLNLHQSHVVEKSKKASHREVEEPAQNSGRDLSPSSKNIFLGKTWAQDTIAQPVHSADTYLTSDVRNSLHLHSIETKKDYTYDVLHTPHLQSDTFQSPALVDVHFSHSKNLFETPKKSFASPANLYSDIHHSASNDYLQSESTAKLLADIKAEFLSPKANETTYVPHHHHYQETPVRNLPVNETTYVSHHHHHHQETPVRNLYQETPIRHLNIETPSHHHQPKDENESLVSTMKNMSGTISYIDDLISDLKHRHDKLNSRYSKTFGSDYDNHVHHTSSYTTGKAEEEKTKKAKAPQKQIQEKHQSKPKETHHAKQNDYAWIKTLFAVLVIILLGVIFNQILSISQDLMQ